MSLHQISSAPLRIGDFVDPGLREAGFFGDLSFRVALGHGFADELVALGDHSLGVAKDAADLAESWAGIVAEWTHRRRHQAAPASVTYRPVAPRMSATACNSAYGEPSAFSSRLAIASSAALARSDGETYVVAR